MQWNQSLEPGEWSQAMLALSAGVAVVVLGAAAASRLARSAVWQRTIWQVATLTLLVLAIGETLGVGTACVGIMRTASAWRARDVNWRARDVSPGAVGVPDRVAEPEWPLARFADQETEELRNEPVAVGNSPVLAADRVAAVDPVPEAVGASSASGGLWGWLALLWAGGTTALLIRIAWIRLRLFRFSRRLRRVADAVLIEMARLLARQLGMRRSVLLVESPQLTTPAAFGILRPMVVIPAGFREEFEPGQQRAILAHELAHLASRDSLWLLGADIACAALWWHPLVWWSCRSLRAASETAADEASLLVPDGPDMLAGCLVALARRLADQRQLAWLSMGGPRFRSGLGRRVERLLSLPGRPRPTARKTRMALVKSVLLLVFVGVAVFSTAWARPQAPFEEGETKMSVFALSWRRSLAAAAVAALLGPLSGQAMAGDEPKKDPPPTAGRENPHPDQPAPERATGVREERGPRERREGDEGPRPEGARRDVERELGPKHPEVQRVQRERQERMEVVMREARELQERAQAIEREIRELGDGQKEKAEDLKRELGRIGEQLKKLRGGEGRTRMAFEGQFTGPNAEAHRRLWHLRIAAENLRAAGMADVAEKVAQEAEKLQRELGDQGRQPGPPGGPEGPGPGMRGPFPFGQPGGRPEGPGARPGMPSGPAPAMDDLRGQMEQMRRQMEELRMQLQRMTDRGPREDMERGPREGDERRGPPEGGERRGPPEGQPRP